MGGSWRSFAIGACASAGIGTLALLPWLRGATADDAGWALLGLGAMVLPGVAGGIWLAREHGRPGAGFVVALGTGMGARLLIASIAAVTAAHAGGGAGRALVLGLAAGFLPVALFEMIWFARRTPSRANANEPGR